MDEDKLDALKLEALQNRIADADEKRTAQKYMTWFSLVGMILYPIVVVTASALGLRDASEQLSDLASIYILSASGITAAYFATSRPEKFKNGEADACNKTE